MTLIDLDVVRAREVARQAARTLKPLRTERTLRMMAKEFAGAWWDESISQGALEAMPGIPATENPQHRSDMFRAMWPDRQVYVTICWPHFYVLARKQALSMLGPDSGVSEHMKARIFDAIVEDREKAG